MYKVNGLNVQWHKSAVRIQLLFETKFCNDKTLLLLYVWMLSHYAENVKNFINIYIWCCDVWSAQNNLLDEKTEFHTVNWFVKWHVFLCCYWFIYLQWIIMSVTLTLKAANKHSTDSFRRGGKFKLRSDNWAHLFCTSNNLQLLSNSFSHSVILYLFLSHEVFLCTCLCLMKHFLFRYVWLFVLYSRFARLLIVPSLFVVILNVLL